MGGGGHDQGEIKNGVSVLEAGFLWRARVLQGPALRACNTPQDILIGFARGAGEISEPLVV
jgi:hypothetical protein